MVPRLAECFPIKMRLNTSTCFILRLLHTRSHKQFKYTLGNSTLHETSHSYLGVEITHSLKWGDHVNTITVNANRALGFNRGNLYWCPQDIKTTAYQTLEYSSMPTHRNLKIKSRVQRRSARSECKDYKRISSVTSMLKALQLDVLEVGERWLDSRINHGQTAIPAEQFLHPVKRHFRNLHNLAFQPAPFNKDCHKYSFLPQTLRNGNEVPLIIANISNINNFKQESFKHLRIQKD